VKILQLLSHDRFDSGGAIQAYLLARELARRGHEVALALDVRKGGFDDATRERITAIGCEPIELPLRGVFGRIVGVRRLRSLLSQRRFDVVHLHRKTAVQRFLEADRVGRVAAIANIGTSAKPSGRHAARLADPRITRVLTVAHALEPLLVGCGVAARKIVTLHGAFDERRFHPAAEPMDRERLAVPRDAPIVGMVANYAGKKGHGILLRAALLVLAQHPDVHFAFAGGGSEVDRFLDDLATLGPALASRVRILGFVDDVAGFLKAADVVVCPSTHGEGLTGAVREALALGRPVVATAVAGNGELVVHGETGWLVPPREVEPVATALVHALLDPEEARRRGERGALRAAGLTSAARAERMEQLYTAAVEAAREADRGHRSPGPHP
jgi:glycosyltransferase involved in cell wall biosynthesis